MMRSVSKTTTFLLAAASVVGQAVKVDIVKVSGPGEANGAVYFEARDFNKSRIGSADAACGPVPVGPMASVRIYRTPHDYSSVVATPEGNRSSDWVMETIPSHAPQTRQPSPQTRKREIIPGSLPSDILKLSDICPTPSLNDFNALFTPPPNESLLIQSLLTAIGISLVTPNNAKPHGIVAATPSVIDPPQP